VCVLTAISPGKPGLAGFTEAKDDGSGAAISHAKLQSNRQFVTISKDVNRGSKNRNLLQIRVLEIKFSNAKLDFTIE